MPAPARGYRRFTADVLDVLHFIRQATALGLTLDEIKDVLDLQRGGEQTCARVTGLLDEHLAGIGRKLAELRRLRRAPLTARRAADAARREGCEAVICRIIEHTPTDIETRPGGHS